LLCAGDPSGALRAYAEAARSFTREGFALKAVAIWRQIRQIIQRQAPRNVELDAEARAALPPLLRSLGLEQDARAIEDEVKNGWH